MPRPLASAMLAALALAPGAMADLVTLAPLKDNTLYQDPTGGLSNGAGTGFFVGANQNLNIRRGVIAFDVAGSIPAGSTITGATLTLHMSSTQAAPVAIEIRRVLADWGEGASNSPAGTGGPAAPGDATWIHTFFPSSLWASAGGDFTASTSATQTVAGIGFYSWSSPSLIGDVQSFLAAPGSNFGWLLLGGEATPQSAKRFDSREHATIGFRPALEITYTPVPGPAGAAALGLGSLLAVRRRRP